MPDDSLIEKLARRCQEASDALLAAQHENPGSDEVDFLADALMSARTALYLARAEEAATVGHAYVSRIAASVREAASWAAASVEADEFGVVRLATGLLMQRHHLSRFAAAAMLEGVCERYRVPVAVVARQIVRDDDEVGVLLAGLRHAG
jgi:hypothetical protein